MGHDELVHVELAPRDDQGAERVVGSSAAGVADEVGVADRDAERVLGAEAMFVQVTIASMTGDGAAAPWVVPRTDPRGIRVRSPFGALVSDRGHRSLAVAERVCGVSGDTLEQFAEFEWEHELCAR
jgi:hypothetical protein